MNFARNLRRARKKAKLSQGDFARLMGVVQGAVSNWEAGIRTPKLGDLDKIAKVLKTTPEELIK